jgi:DNA-binding NarL/FixJ family response regulator
MSAKVILADDHQIVREGLHAVLHKHSDIEIVGEAKTGAEAVELCRKLRPDVVVMDIGMPDLNGMEATRQIVNETPDVAVLALSMHSDRQFAAGMFAAGASGYLLKDCAGEELAEAIRTVIRGQCYIGSGIAANVINDYRQRLGEAEDTPWSVLTERQREVLQLIAEGRTTKQIAAQLYVSVKTVESHRRHIMERLGIHTVAELTKYAVREGLTSVDT